MISKTDNYAIIGASQNSEKFGNKVLKSLKNSGFNVIPINPNEGEIEGMRCYPNVNDYKGNIDVAVMVVPSEITLKILKSLKSKPFIWLQPGSEDSDVIDHLNQEEFEYSTKKCIMVEKDAD